MFVCVRSLVGNAADDYNSLAARVRRIMLQGMSHPRDIPENVRDVPDPANIKGGKEKEKDESSPSRRVRVRYYSLLREQWSVVFVPLVYYVMLAMYVRFTRWMGR